MVSPNYELHVDTLYLWSQRLPDSVDFRDFQKDVVVRTVAIPFVYYHNHGGKDSEGWFSIALQGQRGEDLVDRIKNSAISIESKIHAIGEERYPCKSLFLQFIPGCTLSLNHALQMTFFPWTSQEKRGLCVIIALIVDLATLAFRLIAFVPRALYQRYRSRPALEGIKVLIQTNPFDLRVGEIDVNSFTDQINGVPNHQRRIGLS